MLNDEERKVIDLLKNIDKQKCIMLECPVVKNNIERQLKIIELNRTIRKQSKEIEELKAINKKLEARKYMYNAETGEVTAIPIDNNYISKDKIKAFIKEELPDDEICSCCEIFDVNGVELKRKLQSLLNEEE